MRTTRKRTGSRGSRSTTWLGGSAPCHTGVATPVNRIRPRGPCTAREILAQGCLHALALHRRAMLGQARPQQQEMRAGWDAYRKAGGAQSLPKG